MRYPESLVIGSLVTTPLCTVREDASLAEVSRVLAATPALALAVVDAQGAACGILTATDVLRLASDDAWTIADAMSSVVRITATTSIEDAAALVVRENAHELLVVDDDNRMLGIVSAADIARFLASHYAAAS